MLPGAGLRRLVGFLDHLPDGRPDFPRLCLEPGKELLPGKTLSDEIRQNFLGEIRWLIAERTYKDPSVLKNAFGVGFEAERLIVLLRYRKLSFD